jgi:hypothetical protein
MIDSEAVGRLRVRQRPVEQTQRQIEIALAWSSPRVPLPTICMYGYMGVCVCVIPFLAVPECVQRHDQSKVVDVCLDWPIFRLIPLQVLYRLHLPVPIAYRMYCSSRPLQASGGVLSRKWRLSCAVQRNS